VIHALTAVGLSGYSVYAFHAPIVMAFVVLGLPWWAVYPAVLGFAAAAYRTIERPGIRLGRATVATLHASRMGWAHARSASSASSSV